MNMSDIREINIYAGPGLVAYDFEEEGGLLSVWIGDYAKSAPRSALRTEIAPENTAWIMMEKEQANRGSDAR